MWEVILDTLVESLILLPFLLGIYLLIELMERNKKVQEGAVRLLNGKAAPAVAGAVGVIPQCGFSVVATHLYLQKYIKMGTLVALFLATSDEALPLLLSNSKTFVTAWIVVAIKVVFAIVIGYLVNIFDRQATADNYQPYPAEGCCKHEIEHKQSGFWGFVKHPLIHTALVFAYILAVSIICAIVLYYYEQPIAQFMAQASLLQPLVVSLVGLIPNCGSSVLITTLYTQGIINFGALLAGLSTNSGIALAVLFKDKSRWRSNLIIIAILYIAGVLLGTVVTALFPNLGAIS